MSRTSLRAENERLRAELEQLWAIVYPPPPEPAPDSSEPDRETRYVLCGTSPSFDTRPLAQICLDQIRNQMREVDWQLVWRVEDMPAGAFAVSMVDYVRAGFSESPAEREIRWFRRSDEGRLLFVPSAAQRDAFVTECNGLLDQVKRLLEDAEASGSSGYLLVVDVALARLALARAEFDAGEPWRGSIENGLVELADGRAKIDATERRVVQSAP